MGEWLNVATPPHCNYTVHTCLLPLSRVPKTDPVGFNARCQVSRSRVTNTIAPESRGLFAHFADVCHWFLNVASVHFC